MADKNRISPQEWEQIFQDFRGTNEARNRCLSQHTAEAIVEQALQAVGSKKDFALRLQTLAFLDENAAILVADDPSLLDLLLDTLRSTLQASSPADGNSSSSSSIKEQMMVTVTSVVVSIDSLSNSPRSLEILVEILLVFVNRPNHSSERHLRAIACECLRELEKAYPCLLHGAAGHLLALCQSERTHAGQAYMLLLATVLRNIALYMPLLRVFYAGTYSILFTTVPLVPFSIPTFVSTSPSSPSLSSSSKDFSDECTKEFRRVISFLLEKPSLFTESGVSEFISDLCQIATCLDLQPSLLKIQFWNLLHSYSPISCQAFLTIVARFPDAFEGEESILYKRLVLFSRELCQSLTIRLLAMHWLRGLENLIRSRGREAVLPLVAKSLYPEVFDPLSLKSAKLECLARCAAVFDKQQREASSESFARVMIEENATDMASKLLNDGLICLASYKWLPPSSTETRMVFQTLHRFLVCGFKHSSKLVVLEDGETLIDSLLFRSLQDTLVKMARDVRKLVDRILGLLDRFLNCDAHHGLGERLLRTFSEDLVPALASNSQLPAYFPLMERIAESSKIPPGALIKSLETYIKYKVDNNSGSNAANWHRGSEVLTICRTLLMHHQSSRVFRRLTELFGYICLYFPDIEVRDSARFYLRMLISIPGNRLRDILAYGEAQTEDSKPQLLHVSSFLGSPSPRAYLGKKQSLQVSSLINLTRETPLLVRSSWSLVLYDAFHPILETVNPNPSPNPTEAAAESQELETDLVPADEVAGYPASDSVLRMMDSKTAESLEILRRHFAEVWPSGVKIEVVCRLKVKSLDQATDLSDGQNLTGIYSVVINFSTSGSYGPIPPVRVPFLLSEPPQRAPKSSGASPTSNEAERRVKFMDPPPPPPPPSQQLDLDSHKFSELVTILLEPEQPVPTLVDCHITFTDEDAQTVHGQLESIPVGIEDLFMKPPVPPGVADEPDYLLDLFNAIWFGCSGPGKLGSEIFLLRDGKQGLGLQGSESVKLLEAQADRVVTSVENYLARFVVAVSGSSLREIARDSGKFDKCCWIEDLCCSRASSQSSSSLRDELERFEDDHHHQQQLLDLETDLMLAAEDAAAGGELGHFMVMVFLPPRYHLLLRMEVSDWSTLVRIRTDYWPCLAHVDEFLESFIA